MHTLRGAAALGRVLAVAHLHAGEGQARIVALEHGHEVGVAVALARVVVAGGQFGGVRARLEPPVDARQLHAQVARGVKLVHHVPIRILHRISTQ